MILMNKKQQVFVFVRAKTSLTMCSNAEPWEEISVLIELIQRLNSINKLK